MVGFGRMRRGDTEYVSGLGTLWVRNAMMMDMIDRKSTDLLPSSEFR